MSTATVNTVDLALVQPLTKYLIKLNPDLWIVVVLDTSGESPGQFVNDYYDIRVFPNDNNVLEIWTLPGT